MAGWPRLRTFWLAFTEVRLDGLEQSQCIGWENFRTVVENPDWCQSVRNAFHFAALSVALETVLGMAIAPVLHERFRGWGLLRASVLVPWAIPARRRAPRRSARRPVQPRQRLLLALGLAGQRHRQHLRPLERARGERL